MPNADRKEHRIGTRASKHTRQFAEEEVKRRDVKTRKTKGEMEKSKATVGEGTPIFSGVFDPVARLTLYPTDENSLGTVGGPI